MVHKVAQCPVCGEEAVPPLVTCPACETPHHGECWDWVGGCAIYACSGGPGAKGFAGAIVPRVDEPAPAPVQDGALTLSSTVLQHVREGEIDAIARSYDALPPSLAPLWWIWVTAILFVPLALLVALASFVPAEALRVLAQLLAMHGGKLFLVGAVAMGGLMFFPVALFGSRWRFLLESQQVEHILTWAGLPFFRRRLPFRDVLRIEVREAAGARKLVLIRADGGAVDLSHGMGATPAGARDLSAMARGLQLHSPLHVTTALDFDHATSMKRLETLRHAAREAGGRSRALALISAATPAVTAVTLVALLPPVLAWTGIQAAITAVGALCGAWFLRRRPPRVIDITSDVTLSGVMIAVGSLVGLIITLATTHGFVHLTLGLLAGSGFALLREAARRPALGEVSHPTAITPHGVQRAGEELLGYQPDRAGTLVLAMTQGLLLVVTLGILFLAREAGASFGAGCFFAAIPLTGSVLVARAWARAVALQRHLETAVLEEAPPPKPPPLE